MNSMKMNKIVGLVLAAMVLIPVMSVAQSLYTFPEGTETRWASPENPKGEKGQAAQNNAGRKGRPAIPVKSARKTHIG